MSVMKFAKQKDGVRQSLVSLLVGWLVAFNALSAFAADSVSTEAGPEGPAQTAYSPATGKQGPIIIVMSGQSGPENYKLYAAELAHLGYYVALVDGNDILNPEHTGPSNLKKVIERAQNAQNAIRGKVAVVGFSLGGGGALYSAASLKDSVSMVVAYYPYTRTWADNIDALVKHFKVPVLVLAGGFDRHKNCCLIESMRAMEASAKEKGIPFELVVYPDANHEFNLERHAGGKLNRDYRPDDASDAWRRTVEMLKHYQPLP